jgi:putative nucleotidyltransferase with HDIG domain
MPDPVAVIESPTSAETTGILFVDDEPNVLGSLRRVFHAVPNITCHFAGSPMEALHILAQENIAVIVSDHRMPQMTGAEFLARIKEKRPNTVRIMLTGQADLATVEHAVNSGEIYRFLTKPWKDAELRAVVTQAVLHFRLTTENARLSELARTQNEQLALLNARLEEQVELRTKQLANSLFTARSLNQRLKDTILASTKVLFAMIRSARPELGSHCKRVAEYAVDVGNLLGLNQQEVADLEVAALLHDCGKLGLPTFLSGKHISDYRKEEIDLYRTHPVVGAEYLRDLECYQQIAAFVLTHHERFDGSGFPAGLQGGSIPLQGYIIGLLDEYDHMINRPNSDPEYLYQFTCQRIAEYADKQYPRRLVQCVLDHIETLNSRSLSEDIVKVGIANLVPQTVLARDLYTMAGTLLAARGTTLTVQNISRLRAIDKVDPVAGEVQIIRKTK